VGNSPKPKQGATRREAVEAMRRQQSQADRRRTVLMVVVAVVVGLGIVAATAVPAIVKAANDPKKKDVASFGVAAAEAGCSAPVSKTATGAGEHVDPGTHVDYAESPPAFGKHDGQYITDPRHFYATRDVPPVEKLVHSLEHGYTIVWYDATVKGAQLEALQGLATRMPEEKNPGRWFMVAPWTAQDASSRGAFPAGKHVAITHWGAKQGTWQYCAKPSGEAVEKFVAAHPYTDAPEPGGV
jgi:hypothetical protein